MQLGDRVLVDATPIRGEHVDCRRPMGYNDLRRYDGILLGPGGLITVDTIRDSRSGWQWNISNAEMAKIEAPVASIALGWNLFYGQKLHSLAVGSLRLLGRKGLLTFRHTRDKQQFDSVVGGDMTEVCYCPSIIVGGHKERTGGSIALNIAADRAGMRFGGFGIEPLKQVVREFPGIKIITHMTTDIPMASEIGGEIIDLSGASTAEGLKIYSEFEYVIALRGHGQMIPYGIGCKVIGVNVHPKIAAFGADTGTPVVEYNNGLADACRMHIENYGNIDRSAVFDDIERGISNIKQHLFGGSCAG